MLLLPGKFVHAQITAAPLTGCAPLVGVAFTSPGGVTNMLWNFGDQTGSNLQNPTHTFINAGIYNVIFTGILSGNPITDSVKITVYGKPSSGFYATPPLAGCVPLTVTFHDTSTGGGGSAITAREWTFGDGGTNVGNNANPVYPYIIPGSFPVTLKVTDANGCDTSVFKPAYINTSVPPNAVITSNPSPSIACVPPLNVTFSASSSTSNSTTGSTALTYSWNFGGTNTSTLVTPPAVNYTSSGTFPVTLIVTDNNNCPDTVKSSVVINSPFASFFAVGAIHDTVCKTVKFRDQSVGGANPIYNYGDNTSGTDSVHVYAAAGTYQVTLTVQSGTCVDDTTITIVVENVVANFTSTPHYSCNWPFTVQYTSTSVNASSYNWVFGDGTGSTQQNPSHTFQLPYTNPYTIFDYYYYNDQLTVTSIHNCTSQIIVPRNDTVFKVTARFMPDVTFGCAPLTVVFSDSSRSREPITSRTWIFGDAAQNTGNNLTVTHTYTTPGIYYAKLVVVNAAGCRDTSFAIPIYVGEPSTPNFSVVPNPVCPGVPVQFTDLTPASDSAHYWHYTTDGGMMSSCYTDADPVWSFNTQTGPQSITLTTSYNGCLGSTTIPNAIVVKGPMAKFYAAGDCNAPYTYSFPATLKDAAIWDWDFGDATGLTGSTNANPSHTYTASGDYWVKLTAFNPSSGCPPAVDSVFVRVRNVQANFLSDSIFCKNQAIQFNASSSVDAYGFCNEGYLWYWNDGTHPHNSASPITSHVFSAGGTYYVKLVATDINGCIDTVKKKVDVYGVTANFKSNKIYGCLPLTINFTDSSFADTTIASYSWAFGDGTFSSIKNPSHTYTTIPAGGYWTVLLTVTDTIGCSSSKQLIVFPSLPDTNFVTSSQNICVGDSIHFVPTNQNQVGYSWNFGDLTGPSSQIHPYHVFNTAGTFSPQLTVTDSIGCIGKKTLVNYISVQNYPVAAFTSSADTILKKCYPLLVNYTDVSSVNVFGSRVWNLGNNSTILPNVTVGTTYQLPGTYTVSLIESTTNGCRDTAFKTLKVEGPVGNFSITPPLICKGESVSFSIFDTADVEVYSWDFGDGNIAPGASPISHTFNINPASGQTYVSLVMWSEDSACTATKTNPVYIQTVIAGFNVGSDSILCANTPVIITNQSQNASFNNWNLGNGQTYSGVTPPPYQFSTPGTYTISLSISNTSFGCVDSIARVVQVKALPTVSAAGGDTCLGKPLSISATGGTSYLWTPATGLSSDTVSNPVATPSTSTDYSVVITDANGCTGTATAPVTIYGPLTTEIKNYMLNIGDSVLIGQDLGSNYIYTWNPVIGLSCTTCATPYAQPLVNTAYVVTMADKEGCYSGISRYTIEINPNVTIDVPTAFTPDGDGINDIIFVDGWGIKQLLEYKIYNRWGQLMFETTDIKQGWDGYYRGELQNVETYVYTAKALTYNEGKIITKKGSFNLIR